MLFLFSKAKHINSSALTLYPYISVSKSSEV
jgi:hypothetical protein